MADYLETYTLIQNGEFDEDLERLIDQMQVRLKTVKRVKANAATLGDRVRIGPIKPKVFTGRTGVFKNWSETGRAVIKLDDHAVAFLDPHWRRYLKPGNEIHLPSGTFEVIK